MGAVIGEHKQEPDASEGQSPRNYTGLRVAIAISLLTRRLN